MFGSLGSSFGSSFGGGGGGEIKDPNNGVAIPTSPAETVSSLAWSPTALLLVSGSWDGEVRCWQVDNQGNTKPVGMKKHNKPVLDVCWDHTGKMIFSASGDKQVKMWNTNDNSEKVVASHDQAISCCRYTPNYSSHGMLVTGGWDQKIRYWDCANVTGKPLGDVNCNERVYAMDVNGPMLVAATAENKVLIFDVRKPGSPMKHFVSQLKLQPRVLACFNDQTGYLLGSIGGRVAVKLIEDNATIKKSFTFKCHRVDTKIHVLNAIDFHPKFGTFVTGGSDGILTYWDKDKKQKVKTLTALNAPITAARFSRDGSMLAYAAGYDWHKGEKHKPANQKAKIFLRPAADAKQKM